MINVKNILQNSSVDICSFSEIKPETPIVIALGMFDGVHAGHRELLSKASALAKDMNAVSVVLTFVNHPFEIIHPSSVPYLLTSNKEKAMLMADCGIDKVVTIWFDEEFASLSPDAFIEKYILSMNTKAVVCGFNYSFGKNAKGDSRFLENSLEKHGIKTYVIEKFVKENIQVSSTAIRELIETGKIELANILLDSEYIISGNVVCGFKRGHKLGFPTVNIEPAEDKCILPNGVYLTRTVIDGISYNSVTNIGDNPTFGNEKVSVETHIFDFNEDIYSKFITVKFLSKLRDEKSFNTQEELISQLNIDKESALIYFQNEKSYKYLQ